MLRERRLTTVIGGGTIPLDGFELASETTRPNTTSVLSDPLWRELPSISVSGSPSSDTCSDLT